MYIYVYIYIYVHMIMYNMLYIYIAKVQSEEMGAAPRRFELSEGTL